MKAFEKLVNERIAVLNSNSDFLVRQIQFLAQLLEDYKERLKKDTHELNELRTWLANRTETRRGITDPDKE